MSTKVKLTILGFLVLIAGFFSGWQIISSFEALQKKVGQEEKFNISQLKEALIFWEGKRPFGFEEATKTAEEIKKIPVEKKFKVQILNGSGIQGAAARFKEKLEERIEGIKVVALGNTEVTSTSLLKTNQEVPEDVRAAVLGIINNEFSIVEQRNLSSEAEVDILIILGR